MKQLVVSAAGYKTRTETFEGREYIVVPVVALVEGVVWPMNAETPELVTAEEFSRAPQGWNGRPIFHGHPIRNGRPVSGNVPEVLETEKIGVVFNATIRKNKLAMEAWLDIERAKEVAPELLQRVENGDDIEISVGAFVDTDDSEGTFNGKKYRGAWQDIVPDHLALLPEGVEGACSVQAGCGVRAAQKQEAVVAEKKKQPSILGKFLQMFRAAQPASEMSDGDLRRKLFEALREAGVANLNYVEAFIPVTAPNRVVYSVYEPAVELGMGYPYSTYVLYERAFTLGDNGVVSLGDAAIEVEPVLSYEPVLMAEEPVVAKGARNSKSDQAKIQSLHDHAIALGANCAPKAMSEETVTPKAAAGGCSCGGHGKTVPPEPTTAKETDMKKEELVKFLETATEDQIKALSAVVEKPAEQPAAVAAPAAAAVVTPAAPAAPATEIVDAAKPVTIEDLMAKASPEVKAQFDANVKAAADKHAVTIKALKDTGRCTISDEVLKAKTQVELDQLLALAGKPAVTASVDFGGQGAPRVAAEGESKGVPDVPNLADAIRVAEGKK
jgi:hypothetical protein